MADKKVERNIRSSGEERPSIPVQQKHAAFEMTEEFNAADLARNKGKDALFNLFREREERYRQQQLVDQTEECAGAASGGPVPPADEQDEPSE